RVLYGSGPLQLVTYPGGGTSLRGTGSLTGAGRAASDRGGWLLSTFGTGDNGNPPPTSAVPIVWNPTVANGKIFVDAAASFIISPGATLTLQVPFSTTTYGPYTLNWDTNGTRF